LIRDDEDYRRHLEYCYINPMKHGLVGRVQDWPLSSFHRDVDAGLFPADWAGDIGRSGNSVKARRAQALYCAVPRCRWRNKAIAPYEPYCDQRQPPKLTPRLRHRL
jgi:hypothetical protein